MERTLKFLTGIEMEMYLDTLQKRMLILQMRTYNHLKWQIHLSWGKSIHKDSFFIVKERQVNLEMFGKLDFTSDPHPFGTKKKTKQNKKNQRHKALEKRYS